MHNHLHRTTSGINNATRDQPVYPDSVLIMFDILSLNVNDNYHYEQKSVTLYPASVKELEALGQRLEDARLLRRFSMETVCARADISLPTLYKVENGYPSVAMGIYVQVLRVLGMLNDLGLIAKEDVIGRRLQHEALPYRKRAPKTTQPTDKSHD